MKELNIDGTTPSETGLISTKDQVAKKCWNTPKLMEVDYQHTLSSYSLIGTDNGTYS
jgi:hypothetical protein